MWQYLKNRLAEPSTHVAAGLIFYVAAKAVFPQWGFVIDAVAGVLGITGAALPEKQVGS